MTLDELQKLCDEATGKWSCEPCSGKESFIRFDYGDKNPYVESKLLRHENAAFIAAARTYMPKLIAIARAAERYCKDFIEPNADCLSVVAMTEALADIKICGDCGAKL